MMKNKLRFGLCCAFLREPILFRRTTAAFIQKKERGEQLAMLAEICRHNARSLLAAFAYCRDSGIGCFRINSQILPLKTHPALGYAVAELPGGNEIAGMFRQCGAFCRSHGLRATFHPDQFNVLSSPDPDIVQRAVAELSYQAEVAGWVGADVLNLHAGGAYGDKAAALKRVVRVIQGLPKKIRRLLTLENDDRLFTPEDLLPVCREAGVPLVYDIMHHRVLPDSLSQRQATRLAAATWDREPLVHLSSPLGGWGSASPRNHSPYIDPADFPPFWRNRAMTIEVEAKAKELAVLELMRICAG